jgi:glycosyltransferase involved in cell wall biosynthesis
VNHHKGQLNILMLNHEYPPVGGGGAIVTAELCKQLIREGHKVDVITMHYKGLARFEESDGVKIYRTPALRRRQNVCYTHELATYIFGSFKRALSLVGKERYDIIHCHFIVPGGPLALMVGKWSRIPFIITSHGTDVPGHNPDRFGLMHRLISPAWRFTVRHADVITAPSQYLKDKILKSCQDANVKVIPNGIRPDRFEVGKKEKKILLCSRIFAFKGFQYVIKAVQNLSTDWQVDVIGEGPYLERLKQLAEGSKTKVKFWGWLDRKSETFRQLFEQSSIFVFTSESENFPTVLLEAMSAGCAIIASDIPSHKEILSKTGIFVKPKNTPEIRDRLLYLINSQQEREKLGAANQHEVEQFDWKSITEKYVKCYKATIENFHNKSNR